MDPVPSVEQILAHTAWVRSLARSLVADPGRADDLAQETLIAALEKPPASGVPLRAWLRGVLHKLAASRRRSDERRAARHALLEPAEHAPSSAELASQLEMERKLVREVLALAEPFRRTLLLRYFQGLSSAEIARRTGAPEGTVRWRLKRAIDALRARLDEECGGRESWSLALAPSVRALAPRPASEGGLALGRLAALLLGNGLAPVLAGLAALALLVAGALLALRRGPRTEETAALAPGAAESTPALDAPAARRAQALALAEHELPAGAGDAPAQARELELRARVLGLDGAPLAGALLASRSDPARRSAPSGASGRLELALPLAGSEPGAMLALELSAPGMLPIAIDARWRGEELLHLGELEIAPAQRLAGRVLDAEGNALEGVEVLLERLPEPAALRSFPLDLRALRGGMLAEEAPLQRSAHEGSFTFEDLPRGFVRVWARAPGRPAAHSPVLTLNGVKEPAVELRLREARPEELVRGRVRDAEGAPAAGAHVEALREESPAPHFGDDPDAFRARCDDQGRFALLVEPGALLRIAAESESGARSAELRAPSGAAGLELTLASRPRRRLVARDPAGEPIERLGIEVFDRASGLRLLRIPRAKPGLLEHRFELPSLAYELRLEALGFAPLRIGPLDPREREPLEVQLAPSSLVRGRLQAAGEPLPGARVTLLAATPQAEWHAFAEPVRAGAPFARIVERRLRWALCDERGEFAIQGPPPARAWFRVEAAGLGTRTLGPFALGTRAEELSLELPGTGSIAGWVLVDPGRSPAGLLVGASCGDGRVASARAGADGSFCIDGLAPGAWQVRALARDLAPEEEARALLGEGVRMAGEPRWDVLLAAGERARFDLDLRSAALARVEGRLALGAATIGPWIARLHGPAQGGARPLAEAVVDVDGRFELEAPAPGEHLLVLERVHERRARIEQEVELSRGGLAWSCALETSEVELATLVGEEVALRARTYRGELPGGPLLLLEIEPRARLPLGRGELLDAPFEAATRSSPALARIELER